MSSIIEILQKHVGTSDAETTIQENNCELKVPEHYEPSVVYKFDQSMAQNKIQFGIHSKLPDFLFANNSFKGTGCLVLIELSKGKKTIETVYRQLQSGFSILEEIFSKMSHEENRCLDNVQIFAVYCGKYNKFAHRAMRRKTGRKKGKKAKNKVGESYEMDKLKFDGYKVNYRKCNCNDSISVIESET